MKPSPSPKDMKSKSSNESIELMMSSWMVFGLGGNLVLWEGGTKRWASGSVNAGGQQKEERQNK